MLSAVLRIVTWNVNSLKARLARVEEWLAQVRPDVVCLQEAKLADAAFPTMAFEALGYAVAHHGEGRWNGVAICSRIGLTEVATGFTVGGDDEEFPGEARVVWATCGGGRGASGDGPNGRAPEHEH